MAKFKALKTLSLDEFQRDYESRKSKRNPIAKRVREVKTGGLPDIGKDRLTPEQINKRLLQQERDAVSYAKQVDGRNNYGKNDFTYSGPTKHKRGFGV